MSTRIIHEQEICPFTLEAFQDSCISKAVYPRNVCPFTLEPCLLQAKAADYAMSKLETDDKEFPADDLDNETSQSVKSTGKSGHKNHLFFSLKIS